MADKKVWKIKSSQIKTNEDLRGTFRHDMDKVMGRAMTRYLGKILEWKFPFMDIKVTEGTLVITVAQSTEHTSPLTTVNGDVVINGDLKVNGNVTVTGDVVASGVSLVNHTHPGVHGPTGKPS